MTTDEQIQFMTLVRGAMAPIMQQMCDEVIESLARIRDLDDE